MDFGYGAEKKEVYMVILVPFNQKAKYGVAKDNIWQGRKQVLRHTVMLNVLNFYNRSAVSHPLQCWVIISDIS